MIWRLLQIAITVAAPLYAYYAYRTKVPLVFSARAAQNVILQVIAKEVQGNQTQKLKIYDLGSGLGGLCMAVAKAVPDAEIIGLELAWPAWLFSIIRQKLCRHKNLHFLLGDFWKHNISDGGIVLCYLGDVVMPALKNKLQREAFPGRLFISNVFPLPSDWPPVQRIKIDHILSKEVLVYRQN